MIYRASIFVCLLLIASATARGAETNVNAEAGTSGAAFLKMDPGARAAGLGGAYTALHDDVDALFWNPSGLVGVDDRQLLASHDFAPTGVNHETIAYGQRLTSSTVMAGTFRGVFASIDRRSADTLEPESTFTAGMYAVGVSLAHSFGHMSIGASAYGVQERFDLEDAAGAGVDVGVLYRARAWSVGAAALNLGADLGDAPLPLTYRLGGSASLTSKGPLVLADVVGPRDDHVSVRIGIEHWFVDDVALRGGYYITEAEDGAKGFSFGIGLRQRDASGVPGLNFRLDYAFVPSDNVGDSHRLALLTSF